MRDLRIRSIVAAIPIAVAIVAVSSVVSARQDDLASAKLRVDWATFKARYDAKEIVVIDVRDTTSYEIGHIPGARSIPLPDIERAINDLKKIKKPIVVYCA